VFEACALYANPPNAPENLADSELCYVYQLSVTWGQGYNLDECGVTMATAGGTPQQVCTCSVCSTTVGLLTFWGLGLDCQEALLPGITLVQCQPLTDTNPAVIPVIEEYTNRQDDDPTDAPTSIILPDTTAAATDLVTTVATMDPVTTVAATDLVTTVAATDPVTGTTSSAADPATTAAATDDTATTIADAGTATDPATSALPPIEPTSAAVMMELKVAAVSLLFSLLF